MTHKYERVCWSCGGRNIESMGDYVRCRDCGATWNEVPGPGVSAVTEVDAKTGKAPRVGRPTEYKPRGARR